MEEREEDEIVAEEILDYTFENYDIHAAKYSSLSNKYIYILFKQNSCFEGRSAS